MLNAPTRVLAQLIPLAAASAAEAELHSACANALRGLVLREILRSMGYPQNAAPAKAGSAAQRPAEPPANPWKRGASELAAAACGGQEKKRAKKPSKPAGSQQKQALLATLPSITHPPTAAPRAPYAHASQAKALRLCKGVLIY